ncbi:hypothetical protein C0995_012326 [Termitomyces sp. Mi166|nr:hypothetical protein C0995_012326 [Termitomyces sp. Mi166\
MPSLASGSPMDTSLPMALSTPTPDILEAIQHSTVLTQPNALNLLKVVIVTTGPAQQVMGPKDIYNVSTLKLTIPKLMADGSNWLTYQEHVQNAVTSKKLRCHLVGTTCKPVALIKHSGSFFLNNNSLFLLLDKEIKEHEDAIEDCLQKEVMVHKIIYSMVDQFTFYQVKGELTAADVWKKLASIHGNKDAMYESDLLAQLQNAHYIKNGEIDMRTHLAKMVVIKDHLTKIGCSISDASFASYIHTSLSLAPMFKPLFTTLATSACTSGTPTTSQDLIK